MFFTALHAGVLHPLDIADDYLFFRLPVDCQEFVPAHAVDVFRAAQAGHQEYGDVADVAVAFLVSVKAVHTAQVIDIHKQEGKGCVLVRFEFLVIFGHVVLVTGPGTQSAQRVHHDLPFQHRSRVLQREEESHRDRRDCASGKQILLHLGLDQLGNDKQEQHRQHHALKVPPHLSPVDKNAADCHREIHKRNHEAHRRRRTGAGLRSVQLLILDGQQRRKEQHKVDHRRQQRKQPFFSVHLLRAGQVQRINAHLIGIHNRRKVEDDMCNFIQKGIAQAVDRIDGHHIHHDMDDCEKKNLVKNPDVFSHPVGS